MLRGSEFATGVASRAAASFGSLSAVITAALLPKCPLCVAAALSALGVGTATAHALGPYVRATLPAIAAALVVVAAFVISRRRSARCCATRAKAPLSKRVAP